MNADDVIFTVAEAAAFRPPARDALPSVAAWYALTGSPQSRMPRQADGHTAPTKHEAAYAPPARDGQEFSAAREGAFERLVASGRGGASRRAVAATTCTLEGAERQLGVASARSSLTNSDFDAAFAAAL